MKSSLMRVMKGIMTTGISYLLDASIHFMTMCTFLDMMSCTTRWSGDLDPGTSSVGQASPAKCLCLQIA